MLKQENRQKNVIFEYLRFLNALLIICCHMYMLDRNLTEWKMQGGYIAVEFFIFLTGFLTTGHWDRISSEEYKGEEEKCSTMYMVKKIKKILPYTVTAYIYIYIYVCSSLWNDKGLLRSVLFSSVWDFSLLQTSGLGINNYIQPLWYVSAMIFTLPIFSWICIKWNHFFRYIFSWIVPILIYGWFFESEKTIADSHSILRMFAGLLMGAFCFYISKEYGGNKKINSRFVQIILRIIVVLCVLLELYVASYVKHSVDDFVIIPILVCMIVSISLLRPVRLKYMLLDKIGTILGKISLPVYVFHPIVMITTCDHMQLSLYFKLILTIIISVMVSFLMMGLIKLFHKIELTGKAGNDSI